jgi:hypothetical protein
MKKLTGKTARFSEVVKASGEPEVVYLWTRPEQDKRFMKAVRENRLLTVKQETTGSKADFGVVGFLRERNVSYFEFPKPLNGFQDRRITGIKYELIKAAPIGRRIRPSETELGQKGRHEVQGRLGARAAGEKTSKKRRFKVRIRFTAIAETSQDVEAESKKMAAEKAVQGLKTPDFRGQTVTRKIVWIAEVD